MPSKESLNEKFYKNVCPKNCPSSCTMITYVENNKIARVQGDLTHDYTNGKLCAKGFACKEINYHKDRLKYPLYQKVKGSGDFRQISWDKAYELIISNLTRIYSDYKTLLPVALYKGTGNIGALHHSAEHFFSCINGSSKIVSAPTLLNQSLSQHKHSFRKTNPAVLEQSSTIIIWGANPGHSNIHLIPFLIEAKVRGTTVIVIDPVFTQTAKIADIHIPIKPATDQYLAHLLIQKYLERDKKKQESFDGKEFQELNSSKLADLCGITDSNLHKLTLNITNASSIAHIIGTGILKYPEASNTITGIEALVSLRGDINQDGGGIFYKYKNNELLANRKLHNKDKNIRPIYGNELSYYTSLGNELPVEMLWISCGNPIVQEPNPNCYSQFMKNISFVVIVDSFMTPTTKLSNLILPTTSHFEETDIVISDWHEKIAFNEQAVSPYYQSKSDYTIFSELAVKLQKHPSIKCTFPIHSSEKGYLDAQINDAIRLRYQIKNLKDLEQYSYLSPREDANGKTQYITIPISSRKLEIKSPPNNYPFRLITPNHPHMLGSQFHCLGLTNEKEAYLNINPYKAKELNIANGEIIKIFNNYASGALKAVYNINIQKDVIMVYQGWYPGSHLIINKFISGSPSSGSGFDFFEAFVNIQKVG